MVLLIVPPVAPVVPHAEIRHEETVNDNYFWLRNKEDSKVLKYLKDENKFFENYKKNNFKKLSDQLYKEFYRRIVHDDESVPSKKGNFEYWKQVKKGLEEPLFLRKKLPNGKKEVLLDLNKLKKSKGYVGLGSFEVSPHDESLLIYSLDSKGHRDYEPFLKNLKTEKIEKLPMGFVSDIFWGINENDLFWVKENSSKRPYQLYRYSRKTRKSELLFEETNERFWFSAWVSLDHKFIYTRSGTSEANTISFAALELGNLNFQVVAPMRENHKYDVTNRDEEFFVLSNRKSDEFEIYTASSKKFDEKSWKLLVEAKKGRLIESLHVFKGFSVIETREKAVNKLSKLNESKGTLEEIEFPEPFYDITVGPNQEFEATKFRLTYQSFVSPKTTYDWVPETRSLDTLKVQKIPGEKYNSSEFVSEMIWVKGRDGTQIPVSLVYKKGARDNGPAPMYLYGYGSYGISLNYNFSIIRLSLLQRGVIFAQAHIRGGGDLGEEWRKAGKFLKKKNTFYDFIDVADFFQKEKWTQKDKLAIAGGSAGGLLIGAVLNERPDIAGTAHLAVPFVDVMNTMWDESLPLTTQEFEEWGNPKESKFYSYMKSYCPYTNLKKAEYPAIIVTSSIHDSQVGFWEPAKYVAKLRTLKTDTNPMVMRMTLNSGHGGASGRYESFKEDAEEYGFILSRMGF